jgi:ABC-type transport system substrate-binding protein
MAATYGPQIVNARVIMEHEEEGDFGNAWLQLNAEGTGTGAWKLVSFEPGQEVILERNENYWRGWEGNHFERIIIRVVEEAATMRQLVEPAMSTSWTVQRPTTNGSRSFSKTRRSTSILATAPRSAS